MTVVRVAIAVTLVVLGVTAVLAQQAAPRSGTDGVYTTGQADQGKVIYDEQCALCHGTMTSVTPDMAPLLNDHTFRARWTSRSLGELFEIIQVEMPQDAPGSLSSQQSADLIAYILSANKLPPGDVALTDDAEALTEIPFEPDS